MVLYYCDLLFGLYHLSPLCFATTTFQGPPIEASSIDRTQQSSFHLMTNEEPSLETLWLQNIRTVDKVQIIDRSKHFISFRIIPHKLTYKLSETEYIGL
jgi:hypothetical protein